MNLFLRQLGLLLSLCLVGSSVIAQSRWQVGIELSPMGYTPTIDWSLQDKEVEIGFAGAGFSYKGGIVVYRELGQYLWLQSGLTYSRKSYDGYQVLLPTAIRDRDTVQVNTRIRDIQLPVCLQFRYAKHRWGVVLTPGVIVGFRLRFTNFLEGKRYIYSADSINNPHPYVPAYLSLSSNMGMYYQLNKGSILMFQVEVEYEFESTIRREPLLRTASKASFYPKITLIHTLN